MGSLTLIAALLVARHRPSRPPTVGTSDAQIVFMAPVKVSTMGARGFELVTMNLDGSNRKQLTDNERQEFLPHFSPDGRLLVYTMFTTGGYGLPESQSDVGIYDFARKAETNVTQTGKDSYPVWSPEGSSIAFLSIRAPGLPGPRLWIMNADGSQAHEIAGPSGAAGDVLWGDIAWSSDNWILFVWRRTSTDVSKLAWIRSVPTAAIVRRSLTEGRTARHRGWSRAAMRIPDSGR